jgi:hypothetical protein
MELIGLIQVRYHAPLMKSDSKAVGKAVERHGSMRTTSGTECKHSSMELNGLF